jgi:hypothetical protein
MNSLLLFRDQMRLWRHEGWRLVGIDVVKTSHTAPYSIESLAATWARWLVPGVPFTSEAPERSLEADAAHVVGCLARFAALVAMVEPAGVPVGRELPQG